MPTKGVPNVYVPADGPQPCRILIVGEAPGVMEAKMGYGFVGPSGEELWHLLDRYAHIRRNMCRVTNVFHWPLEIPFNRVPYRHLVGTISNRGIIRHFFLVIDPCLL